MSKAVATIAEEGTVRFIARRYGVDATMANADFAALSAQANIEQRTLGATYAINAKTPTPN